MLLQMNLVLLASSISKPTAEFGLYNLNHRPEATALRLSLLVKPIVVPKPAGGLKNVPESYVRYLEKAGFSGALELTCSFNICIL